MNGFKSTIVGIIAAVASVTYANAATLLVDSTGELLGAVDVDVNGTLYNVRFTDGTCTDVFGSCEVSAFAFDNSDVAEDAAQALLDQVFLDASSGLFGSDPILTAGCNSGAYCAALIPYNFDSSSGDISHFSAFNKSDLDSVALGVISGLLDFTDLGRFTYADFSVSPTAVPIPGAIPFMLTGLIGVGWMKRRKKEA